MARAQQAPIRYPRKIRKSKPLSEIYRIQRTTCFLVGKAPMQRLIREIAQSIRSDLRFRLDALLALQEAAETFIVKVFEETNLLAIHRKAVAVSKRDLDLVLHFMSRHQIFSFRR